MATNKKLRTPIIKPRKQGGTFYTFGSAMEDIGLNINERTNRIEISHYVLLNIPSFDSSIFGTPVQGTYVTKKGDYIFAEAFQDYVLNMETVLRNQDTYNYTTYKTVSERVFWKWLFKDSSIGDFGSISGGYYYEKDIDNSIAKSFGRIYSGSQRSDEYGLYNETFVQIPSSYGQMRIFYKPVYDENYRNNKLYGSSDSSGIIENITNSEYDASLNLNMTGISASGIFDSQSYQYQSNRILDFFEAKIDTTSLREIYDSTVTYDKIGFGDVIDPVTLSTANTSFGDFSFNSILVYYSIYDSTGMNILATNAYGIYILDSAIDDIEEKYSFPRQIKKRTTSTTDGTSFSFRLNIKPSSAYTGDITVNDNSSGGFSASEDFNDVIRNLNASINILRSNSKILQKIVNDNDEIKSLAIDAVERVNDIDVNVRNMKNNGYICKMCDNIFTYDSSANITILDDLNILNGVYKNLRLSDGTVVSRSVVSGAQDFVYLMYEQIVVDGVNKIRKKIHKFEHNLLNGEKYIVRTVTTKDQNL